MNPVTRLNLDDRPPRTSRRTGRVLWPDDPEYWEQDNDKPTVADNYEAKNTGKTENAWSPGSGRILPLDSPKITYTPLHHQLVHSKDFVALTLPSLQVLLHLMVEFNGYNNGQLTVTLREMREFYRWGDSPGTLQRALKHLNKTGFIRLRAKRVGAAPARYELTWLVNRKRAK